MIFKLQKHINHFLMTLNCVLLWDCILFKLFYINARYFLIKYLSMFQVKQMLNDLSTEWVTFQEKLIEAEGMLKKHKVCI